MYKTIHKIRLRTRQKASTPSCALFTTKFVAEKQEASPSFAAQFLSYTIFLMGTTYKKIFLIFGLSLINA